MNLPRLMILTFTREWKASRSADTRHNCERGHKALGAISRARRRSDMTDRRDEVRERREDDVRRREERERRSDELKESWRRNHPSEEEDAERDRPRRGRRRPA